MGELLSVNVGVPRQIIGLSRRGRPVISGIGKSPVTGRVAVRGVNLAGDDQADRSVHGGPDKAVYAYASEDSAWWATVLGSEVAPGAFGENLSTAGGTCPVRPSASAGGSVRPSLRSVNPASRATSSLSLSTTPEWCAGSPTPACQPPTCASLPRVSSAWVTGSRSSPPRPWDHDRNRCAGDISTTGCWPSPPALPHYRQASLPGCASTPNRRRHRVRSLIAPQPIGAARPSPEVDLRTPDQTEAGGLDPPDDRPIGLGL